jgi:DNA-binding NarL/FixJ family response regulator
MAQEDCSGIVIVSMTLDGLAGFALVNRLKELPEPSRPGSIAVMALAPDPEDLQRSRMLGCSGYFVRSTISIEAFIQRICSMHALLSRSTG